MVANCEGEGSGGRPRVARVIGGLAWRVTGVILLFFISHYKGVCDVSGWVGADQQWRVYITAPQWNFQIVELARIRIEVVFEVLNQKLIVIESIF